MIYNTEPKISEPITKSKYDSTHEESVFAVNSNRSHLSLPLHRVAGIDELQPSSRHLPHKKNTPLHELATSLIIFCGKPTKLLQCFLIRNHSLKKMFIF